MNRDTLKRIYDLHAWTGILTGWFIFVVCFSGIPALFYAEIETWEKPNTRIVLNQKPVELLSLLNPFIEDNVGSGDVISVNSLLPTAEHPFYRVDLCFKSAPDQKITSITRTWNPNTGEILPEKGKGLSHWLRDFHRNLMLNRTLGRTIVGLAGIMLMVSLVSGVLTHKKFFKEMFTWRVQRSIRLKWQDTHKVIGLWGLPYAVIMSFTGAFLGLLVIMLPITGALVFKGDRDAIVQAVNGPSVQRTEKAAKMQPFQASYDQLVATTGAVPKSVFIERWGDETAQYTFLYKVEGKLIRYGRYVVSGANGALIENALTPTPGVSQRVLAAIKPLHYATYGGLWLKALYSVLAGGLCLLIATGSMMWLERRLYGNAGTKSPTFYRTLSRLTMGITTGVIFASVAVFYGDKLLNVLPETRLYWIGIIYFSAWALVIVYALLRANEYRACKDVLTASACGLMGIPLLNVAATGGSVFEAFRDEVFYVAGVDITAFILGLIALWIISYIPNKRGLSTRKSPSF